jgi:hypothetical protein
MSAREPKKPPKGFGPAAGTRQGSKPRLSILRPPELIVLRHDELIALRNLSDFTTRGLYQVLCEISDFETGEVHRDASYPELMAFGQPPRAQQGPTRLGPQYNAMRRMLADLESVGLVHRNTEFNKAHGLLLMTLPYRAAAAAEWKKKLAQRKRPQELPQGRKARKPA